MGKYAHAAQPVPQPSLPVREPPTSCGKPAASVWDRSGNPPAHLLSKRSQALWLLGLDVGPGQRATQSELRQAYRRAAMESHPDKMQNHSRQDEAKQLFQRVNEAFNYLNAPTGALA